MKRSATAFAPASVSNIACGFDILGFALRGEDAGETIPKSGPSDGPGDVVTARAVDRERAVEPVRIASISGDGGMLPHEPHRNTAATAAWALIKAEAPDAAVELEIQKRMPLESGLGSSAASAVAAVVAVDALLGLHLPPASLLRHALAGEMVASGGAHADNLAPSLVGGIVLVRSLDPEPDVVELPVPEGLTCALLRPHVSVNTRESRAQLDRRLPLERAVTQWGNAAALVAALYRSDLELLSRSLVDVVAEPVRGPQVPGFLAARGAALAAGALGCSLSGSGPALFALCDDHERAREVADAMATALKEDAGLDSDRLVSLLPAPGARVIAADWD